MANKRHGGAFVLYESQIGMTVGMSLFVAFQDMEESPCRGHLPE